MSKWYQLHNNAMHFYERYLSKEITEKYLIKNIWTIKFWNQINMLWLIKNFLFLVTVAIYDGLGIYQI